MNADTTTNNNNTMDADTTTNTMHEALLNGYNTLPYIHTYIHTYIHGNDGSSSFC